MTIPLIVGRAGFEIAKTALKTGAKRVAKSKIGKKIGSGVKRIPPGHPAAEAAIKTGGVAAGVGTGLAISKTAQKKIERERAATRKRKAMNSQKPRNRMGKRGTQSGVAASTNFTRGDGIVKTGHTRGTQR